MVKLLSKEDILKAIERVKWLKSDYDGRDHIQAEFDTILEALNEKLEEISSTQYQESK